MKNLQEELFYKLLGEKLKDFLTDMDQRELDYEIDFEKINTIDNQDEMTKYISKQPDLSKDWNLYLFCQIFNLQNKIGWEK